MYKIATLENGLRVLSHRMPGMDSVALGIWVRTGARYEEKQYQGIAHFLEHLLFKGSKRYSARRSKEIIEGVGGNLNGFTSEEYSCYLVKTTGKYLAQAVDVLSDMVINPLLKPEDIERERSVIIEEIKMYRDIPAHFVHDILDRLMWPGHPLGRSIIGTLDTLGNITRKRLDEFQGYYYTPSNIIVVACGKVNHDELKRLAKRAFGKVKARKRSDFEKVDIKQKSPQLDIFFKKTEQTHLSLGLHSYPRQHPRRHTLNLLHIILGGNMSSRLFWRIRERAGLAYEISTQVVRFSDTGAFLINAGIDNKKVESALELIIDEIRKIKKSPVTESEFNRAKEFYQGQFLMGLEDTTDFMLWLGENLISLDRVYTPKEILREMKKVKRHDIYDVANEVLRPERLSVAAIGPLSRHNKNDIREIICKI
ncbi:MAG: pitrilysin family protein [Candidatus Omnitrophota bacterium]